MLLDIDKWCNETIINKKYIPEITSTTIKLSNGTYDPNGLFSTEIFGQDRSTEWKNQYAKITLPHPVIHPAIFYIINRRISYLLKYINLENGFVRKKDGTLVLTNTSSEYTYCGIESLYKDSKLVCKSLLETGLFDTDTAKIILSRIVDRKIPVFTSNVIVMPPIFRPEDSDSDANGVSINKTYIKLIEEVNILKSSLSSNDRVLVNRILANIQNIYNTLFNAMILRIKGKTGLIRSAMLGKNCDFSGRAVIVGDPYIKPSQLGVPRTMLIKLFYPWIIHKITTTPEITQALEKLGVACNIARLFNLINTDIFEKTVDKRIVDILNEVMEEVIKDKVVIAKRDPVLHKLSVRGFYPVPVDDSSLHISPLVCSGFNADFDGDQMALFVPLTTKAQNIVKNELLATKTLYHPLSGLSFTVAIDFVLGLYLITKDDIDKSLTPVKLADNVDIVDLLFKTESFAKSVVTYKGRTNTIGRRVVELIYNDHIKVDEPVTKKKIAKTLEEIAKNYPNEFEDIAYRIMKVAAVTSSIYGGTMSVKDFKISEELRKRRDEVLAHPDKYDVDTELEKITSEYVDETYKKNQLPTLLVKSGARGSNGNLKQVAVAKGYISDATGKVLPEPVGSCFADGFSPVDYFTSSYGNRKGVIDRSQNTANSGYLQRQMIYLAMSVKSSDVEDCHTDHFFTVMLTEDNINVLKDRVLKDGNILTPEYAEKNNLIGKRVQIYSPMYCKSHGLCKRCYPEQYRFRNNSSNVGLIAANIIGERASQLTMTQFHTGGAASILYITKEAPQMVEYINQDNNSLIAKKDIRIDVHHYENPTAEEVITREFTITDLKNNESVDVDFPADIVFNGLIATNVSLNNDDGEGTLTYSEGDTVGEISATATDTSSAVLSLQRMFIHTNEYEDGGSLTEELCEMFRSSEIPMIFFEILVSQIMRDPDKLYYPYRYSDMKKKPYFASIKAVPGLESPKRGLMFEKVLDIVANSVLKDTGSENDPRITSDIEALFDL